MIQLGKQKFDEVDLLPGETIADVYEGNALPMGANPLAKMIGVMMNFIIKITGGHNRMYLVLTNMRVLLVTSTQVFCGCTKARNFNTIASSSILEAGVTKNTQYCCFHARNVQIQSKTQLYSMEVKKFKDEDLREFMATFSDHIIKNSSK